jgi:tripartite-type tricarboxylate transporter receptor subunit TctC
MIRRIAAIAALALSCLPASPTRAETLEEFYRGKTIEIVIGAAAGGGYDLAGRTLAQHLGRHVPGTPNVVVRNMPGAASISMTNWLYGSARRDGTILGMPNNNVPLEPRLRLVSRDGSNLKFDISRLAWIGSPVQEPQILFVWHTVPAQTFADLRTGKTVIGATAAGADAYSLPALLNRTAGTKLDIVAGYPGQNDLFIALERGEIQASTSGISTLLSARPHLVKEGKVRVLAQFGLERHVSYPQVPTAIELVDTQTSRDLWRFYSLKYAFARLIAAPPEVPPTRIAALRAAFEATMKDPRYVAEAERLGLDVSPLSGAQIERLLDVIRDTPQPVVDTLREMLAAK